MGRIICQIGQLCILHTAAIMALESVTVRAPAGGEPPTHSLPLQPPTFIPVRCGFCGEDTFHISVEQACFQVECDNCEVKVERNTKRWRCEEHCDYDLCAECFKPIALQRLVSATSTLQPTPIFAKAEQLLKLALVPPILDLEEENEPMHGSARKR